MTEYVINKILLLVETTDEAIGAGEYAVQLAKSHGAKIFALNVVDNMLVEQLAKVSDKKQSEVEIEIEENGWKYLYFAEEMAKDEGVQIIIGQEKGLAEGIIVDYASKNNIDCIVFGYSKGNLNTRRLANKTIMNTIEKSSASVFVVQ